MTVRNPSVAGSFYPQDTVELRRQVERLLREAPGSNLHPKALIVPHAGYIYSGPVAATAFKTLASSATRIKRVVLLGPSHRIPLWGMALPGSDTFRTPLGDISIDHESVEEIRNFDGMCELPEAHRWEHSLEVQLPFIQLVLGEISLVPLVVGKSGSAQVATVLETLWGNENTLIVVSSDLSHYHSYLEARRLDTETTRAIENFSTGLSGEQACGYRPINGLLRLAANLGLKLTTLDLRNSGDTAGPRDQVVGYGAYALY